MGFVWVAGGECCDCQSNSAARMDAGQHRKDEAADEPAGLCLRLVARNHNLPAGLLQVEPVVLSQTLRARAGVSQEEQGELVSEVRDRPGERASSRRLLLAA